MLISSQRSLPRRRSRWGGCRTEETEGLWEVVFFMNRFEGEDSYCSSSLVAKLG